MFHVRRRTRTGALVAAMALTLGLVGTANAHDEDHAEAISASNPQTQLRLGEAAAVDGPGEAAATGAHNPYYHAGHGGALGRVWAEDAFPAAGVNANVEYVGGSNGFTGGHVMTRGDRLYVGAYGLGMRIFDVSEPGSPVQIGEYIPGGPRADAVPEAGEFDGRHIAVLNGTRRTTNPDQIATDRSEFLDVTDAGEPILLHEFLGQDDGEAHNGDYVPSKRLWLPSGGSGAYGSDGGLPEDQRPQQRYEHHRGLRIYDIAPTIDTPADECRPYDGWDNPCAPRLIFAANPVELWERSPHRKGREVGHDFTHTHDISVYEDFQIKGGVKRDIILLAEGGSYLNDAGNTGSIFIIDITNPRNPVVRNRFIHPGYEDDRDHRPIRYYHEAQFLDGDPSVMLVTDEDLHSYCEDGGRIYSVRISPDLREATPLDEWAIPNGTPAPVCSVHVFDSEGSDIFIGSYNAGLQVLDASDPADLKQVAEGIQPGTTAWGAWFHEGYVYVGDMTRGLDVFDYSANDDASTRTTFVSALWALRWG